MSLSAKQLGMAWINSKLVLEKINPDEEELQQLNGGKPIKPKVLEEAIDFIRDNLTKLKEAKYQPYCDKYCNLGETNAKEESIGTDDKREQV